MVADAHKVEQHEQFRQIVYEFEPRIRAYLQTISLNVREIDDVLQETFIIVWKRFDHFTSEVKAHQRFAWICGAALNSIRHLERTHVRHLRRVRRINHDRTAVVKPGDTNNVIDERMTFTQKIASMSLEERLIATLLVWEDANAQTIATLCNCSQEAAYKKLQRVTAKLRKAYEHEQF